MLTDARLDEWRRRRLGRESNAPSGLDSDCLGSCLVGTAPTSSKESGIESEQSTRQYHYIVTFQ
ncbi:uncharacterized protein HfgLR_12620 [Haloferax gibbonsii]|uniref:Uncharacterized protein n=1 Tax=Haloferax gibbonsii TaxID=35746 RepID=A0A871BIQ9_HALGI|nr:uncharacterized protein HfgLR_12620 [Haloferax gibbonsii]